MDTVGDTLIMDMVGDILIMDTAILTTVGVIILTMATVILTMVMVTAIIHTIPAEEVLLILTECTAVIITTTEAIRKTEVMLTEEQVILISIEMVRPQPVLVQHSEEVIHNLNPNTTRPEQIAPEVKTTILPDRTTQVTTQVITLAVATVEADHLAAVAERLAAAAEDPLAVVVEEDNPPILCKNYKT
jgi:hypothetical protein